MADDPNVSSDEDEPEPAAPRRSTRNNRQTDFYDNWSKEQMKSLLRELKETGVDLGGIQMNAGIADMRQKLRELQKKGVINKGIIQ